MTDHVVESNQKFERLPDDLGTYRWLNVDLRQIKDKSNDGRT